MPGTVVRIDNNSGGNEGKTNTRGFVRIDLGEPEVSGIDINGVRIMERHWFAPTVWEGLRVSIVVKDAQRIRSVVPAA